MKPRFIHLRVHSDYSLVDGIAQIEPLLDAVSAHQMPAVALTDQNNLFATVKFFRQCYSKGVKPILGSDVLIHNSEHPEKPHRLVLLCLNETGYKNLTILSSKGYREGQVRGVPILAREWIESYQEGLIALSGGLESDIATALLSGNITQAEEILQHWKNLFGNRYYVELQRTGKEHEELFINEVLPLAAKWDIPVVATNNVRFITREDFEVHETRVCISSGDIVADSNRKRFYTQEQYLRSEEEMCHLFADIPEALENTVEIAKRCTLTLHLGDYYLPNFPIPDGYTIESYMNELSEEGLNARFKNFGEVEKANQSIYQERLRFELSVINTMGYTGYFLIVADFIRWSKENDIPVGPGRGSGAGSLVAYALGITDLDPLKYDLLFERFLNPERVSMPDFDVDFCMEGRDRVIDYVAEKYGRESVSQIITYGTMAAKAAIRDVGRVLGHPYGFVDQIAKLIPFELGITIDKALSQEEALSTRYQEEEDVRGLIDLARALEGMVRNAGKHAGGVVIAPSKLTNFTPIYCEEGSQSLLSQFDKDDVEAIGLVKFDFLGLRTLTIIKWALRTINRKRALNNEAPIDITNIPLDDEKTFDLLKACETTAVFQLESRGMKDIIVRLKPDCFEEIIALVALFRPGPLQSGMVDDFINRKHGLAPVEYPHPDLEPILKPTYGIILYQEQVMQIAQVLANYTLGGADLLRRAMGKKKPEEMAKQREIFTKGAVSRGVDAKLATSIFDLMEKFAGYGFNKSHSAAYALLSYQTAWLKAHFPAEFMAAVLSSDMTSTDKVVILVEECYSMKLTVIPPNVNLSEYPFTVNEENAIIYGLGALKGLGESAAENLVHSRPKNGYSDLFQLCRLVDLKKMNKRGFEALIKSGGFDVFQQHRASLYETFPVALKLAEKKTQDKNSGQGSLFSLMPTQEIAEYVQTKPWSEKERLAAEKEITGLYFSGHPLTVYEKELAAIGAKPIAALQPSLSSVVTIAGFISSMRTLLNKREERMAFLTLADKTGKIDIAVFSDVYQTYRSQLESQQLLIVEGEISLDEYSGGTRMSCRRVFSIEEMRKTHGKELRVYLQKENFQVQFEKLKGILQKYTPGTLPVTVSYETQGAQAAFILDKRWFVRPTDELLEDLSRAEILVGNLYS